MGRHIQIWWYRLPCKLQSNHWMAISRRILGRWKEGPNGENYQGWLDFDSRWSHGATFPWHHQVQSYRNLRRWGDGHQKTFSRVHWVSRGGIHSRQDCLYPLYGRCIKVSFSGHILLYVETSNEDDRCISSGEGEKTLRSSKWRLYERVGWVRKWAESRGQN